MSTTVGRYPLLMNHPNYWPGYIGDEQTGAGGVKYYTNGLPARFPPVTVNTADQEEEYASKGYAPAGISDFAAYQRALAGTTVDTEDPPEGTEYPKWVPTPGGDVLCETAEEEAAALGGNPPTRAEPEPVEQVAEKTPEQLEIEALKRQNAELIEMLKAAKQPVIEELKAEAEEGYVATGPDHLTPAAAVLRDERPEKPSGRGTKAWATRRERQAQRAREQENQPKPDQEAA